jgi:midasin (ATPase involved in ribosome maturation)
VSKNREEEEEEESRKKKKEERRKKEEERRKKEEEERRKKEEEEEEEEERRKKEEEEEEEEEEERRKKEGRRRKKQREAAAAAAAAMATIRALNVAEKPSVARAVAEILSRGGLRSRHGHSVYNRIFEFEYSVGRQECAMAVTSVTGHLMELDFEERFRKWSSCDPAELYHAPVRKFVPADKLPLQRTLQEEARRCQWLILWLDCDREGENIAFEVVDICRSSNPRLTIWRARFSALIDRFFSLSLSLRTSLHLHICSA